MKFKILPDTVQIRCQMRHMKGLKILYRQPDRLTSINVVDCVEDSESRGPDKTTSASIVRHKVVSASDVEKIIYSRITNEIMKFLNDVRRYGVKGILIDGKVTPGEYPIRRIGYISIPLDKWCAGVLDTDVMERIKKMLFETPAVSAVYGPQRMLIATPLKEPEHPMTFDVTGVWFDD